jgi:hypothetical protein
VAVVDPDGGGASSTDGQPIHDGQKYESFNVTVNVTDLLSYYMKMGELQGAAMGKATEELSQIAPRVQSALTTPKDGRASILPEGYYMANTIMQRVSDFQNFFQDVARGLQSMGAAATVIAEIYQNTDDDSAAALSVDFAFGDPGAARPKGFRRGQDLKTLSDIAMEQAAAAGQGCMAAMDNQYGVSRVTGTPDHFTVTYSDNSSKYVAYTYGTDPTTGAPTEITMTTITGPDGKRISSTTTETFTAGGSQYQRQTVINGDDKNNSMSVSTTQTDANGKITVNNATQSTVDGKTGQTQHSDPVVINPGDHSAAPNDAGPVQQAETQYNSVGGDQYRKDHGGSY